VSGNLPAIESIVIDATEVRTIVEEPTVSDLMDDVKGASAELVKISNRVESQEAGTGLVAVESAPEIKKRMAVNRAEIMKTKQKLSKATAALEARVQADLEAANAILKPLMEQVERLEEGIWTVNLYLGRDEKMVRLIDGAPAATSEPIAVRQMVLAMDEECRIAAEKGGIDAQGIESFDEWLLADPANIQQVIPEQRAVVVLVPSRQKRDYGSVGVNIMMDEENAKSYWLIRNGENLVRMTTDLEVGQHVIPAQDEFTKFFRQKEYNSTTHKYEWIDLEPGSKAWLNAEKEADKHKRHYMRVALVLQGLIDRTAVFHPLPTEAVSFLQPDSYDEGYVRIITDAELALGTGLTPYKKWLHGLNRELRPGMRIIGAFHGSLFRSQRYARRDEYDDESHRVTPKNASEPESNMIHYIDGFSPDGGFTFKFKRSDMKSETHFEEDPNKPGWGWKRYRDVEFKARATCTVFAHDDFIIPIDLITVEELQAYLDARTEREHYVSLIPLMKTAMDVKRAEFAEEAPVRQLITGIIMREEDATLDEIEDALPDLITWWKLGNRWHRPLVSDDSEEFAKAMRMISTEFRARRTSNAEGAAQEDVETRVVETLVQDHSNVVAIFRKRDGKFAIFTAANDRDIFVHRHIAGLRTESKLDREWILPGNGWRKWRCVYSTQRWIDWEVAATLKDNLTQPEKDDLVAQCLKLHPECGVKLAVRHYSCRGDRGQFEVHARGERAATFPTDDHLLTGEWSDIQTVSFRVDWERKGSKVNLCVGHWPSDQRWGNTFNHGSGIPWIDSGKFWTVLWEQPGAVDTIQAERADYLAARERAKPLGKMSSAIQRGAEDAWMNEMEANAYERFIEDYADPELWDDHRKTLNFPQSPFYFRNSPMKNLADRVAELGAYQHAQLVTIAHLAELVGFDTTGLEDVLHLSIESGVDQDDEWEDEWEDE